MLQYILLFCRAPEVIKLPIAILDLVFSNEEGMVSDTSYFPGLGSSYHICIRFKLNCYSERSEDKLPRLNLHKADYVKMR